MTLSYKLILTLFLFFISLITVGQNLLVPLEKEDSANASVVRFEFFGFNEKDNIIIKVDNTVLFDTIFDYHLLRSYYLLELTKGQHTVSISSKEKAIIALKTFQVQSASENKTDTGFRFCNTIWLGYVPKHHKIENYRLKTIEQEHKQKIKDWHLSNKELQQKYRQELEKTFMETHGMDLDFTGKDEYFDIRLLTCKG